MSENKTLTQETQLTRQDKDFIIPPVDVIEDSTGITLYADLPGVSKDKLNLQVETDTLIIEGELNLDLLKLRIPKADHAQPRKIAINVE